MLLSGAEGRCDIRRFPDWLVCGLPFLVISSWFSHETANNQYSAAMNHLMVASGSKKTNTGVVSDGKFDIFQRRMTTQVVGERIAWTGFLHINNDNVP